MKQAPVSKSFINHKEIARAVSRLYGLHAVYCQLITATSRDVYLVTSTGSRHILTIYQHAQHTKEEVAAEWRFLNYLAANGVAVAPPVATSSGEQVIEFLAPEGTRMAVLSEYVEGENLRRRPSAEAVYSYGRTIAQIHKFSDQMPFVLQRPENNIRAIIDQAIDAFAAEALGRTDDLAYLRHCAQVLCAKVEQLPAEQPWYGFIHGDVIRANALVSALGQVTVIDFELCGPGWRAYDVASYLHTIRTTPEEYEFEEAFLHGYSAVRPLHSLELELLPVFEAVRAIFSIGIPAANIHHWGSAYFYAYLDDSLHRLRSSMARLT